MSFIAEFQVDLLNQFLTKGLGNNRNRIISNLGQGTQGADAARRDEIGAILTPGGSTGTTGGFSNPPQGSGNVISTSYGTQLRVNIDEALRANTDDFSPRWYGALTVREFMTVHDQTTGKNIFGLFVDTALVRNRIISGFFDTNLAASCYPISLEIGDKGNYPDLIITNTSRAVFGHKTGLSSDFRFEVVGEAASLAPSFGVASNGGSDAAIFHFMRSRGTLAIPNSILNGDLVGEIDFAGQWGATTTNRWSSIKIQAIATNNFSSTVGNTDLIFSLAGTALPTLNEFLRLVSITRRTQLTSALTFNDVVDELPTNTVGILKHSSGPLVIYYNSSALLFKNGPAAGGSRAELNDSGTFTTEGNLQSKSGTAFIGTFDHAITAARTWTFQDVTGTIYETSGIDVAIADGGTNSSTALNNGRVMISSGGAIIERAALTNDLLVVGDTSGNGIKNLALGAANRVLGIDSLGTANEYKDILGTANQIIVTHAANSITFSLPQNIHTSATPQFTRLGLGNAADGTASLKTAAAVIIGGDLDHDGTNIGFFATLPVARPAAYTQTYVTTTRIHANFTSGDLTGITSSTTGTVLAEPSAAYTQSEMQQNFRRIQDQFVNLRTDVANIKQLVNQILDDIQGFGLLQ